MEKQVDTLTSDQTTLDQQINQFKEDAWGYLVATKFRSNTVEELEKMKVLWSHGFMRGAEASVVFTKTLYDKYIQKINEKSLTN